MESIKLIWNLLVRRLKLIPLSAVSKLKKDMVAHTATAILSKITHDDVKKAYEKSFVNKLK